MAQGPHEKKINSMIGYNYQNPFQNQQKDVNQIKQLTKANNIEQNQNNQNLNPEQDDLMRQYNDRINKKYEELQQQKKGNSLINFQNLDEKTMNNLIIESNKISPLVKALEDENSLLKSEVSSLANDLARFMEWVELLLEENRFMRQHINKKNIDIKNVIQTIGLNESEKNMEQNYKNHILSEENNILIKHLEELKQFKDEYQAYIVKKEKEMEDQLLINSELRDDLDSSLKREENLSKNLIYYKSLYEESQTKNQNLEKQILQKNEEISNENLLIIDLKQQIKLIKDQKNDQEIESKKQVQKLEQENGKLQQTLNETKEQLNIHEGKQSGIQNELNNLRKENKGVKINNQEIYFKHQQLLSELDLEKTKSDNLLKNSREIQAQLIQVQQELEVNQKKWEIMEKQYKNAIELIKQESISQKERYESQIKRNSESNGQKLKKLEEEYENLNRAINNQNRVLERKDVQINQLKEDLEEQKNKNQQIYQKSSKLDNISRQLQEEKDKVSQLLDDKNILNQQIKQLQTNNSTNINNNNNNYNSYNKMYKQNQPEINNTNTIKITEQNPLLHKQNMYLTNSNLQHRISNNPYR